ncbi:MAG TPA: SDR family oxidoreductase [Chitinophagaceae bacterium]|nr:SDR family oxidoreductase [Chitinophagaceae bacterium]
MGTPKKTILITGASGGIGTHLSRYFLLRGYNMALHYFNNKINIASINTGTLPGKIITYKADIRNEQEIEQMVSAIKTDFGTIDILINNAGVIKNGMSWKLPLEHWQIVIDTNLTGVFLTTKHCLPLMRANNWGRVINISSVIASAGLAGSSAYAASKAALAGFVKTVAIEIADKNITVNNIAAGYMDTGMVDDIPVGLKETILKEIPVKKFGDPEEICALAEYIISDNASYFTGQTIALNGGMN